MTPNFDALYEAEVLERLEPGAAARDDDRAPVAGREHGWHGRG